MSRVDIIQELNELGSRLEAVSPENLYSVPNGFFESFASSVLQKIATSSLFSKENPYSIPTGYFDNFPAQMMETIKNHPDYLNSQEELKSISPLLSSLNKAPVYSVPEDYFGNFSVKVNHKPVANKPGAVIRMFSTRVMRYAAAAIVTGLIIATSIFIAIRNSKPSEERTISKVEKDVNKMKDVKQLDKLTDLMNADLNEKSVASNNKIKTDDIEKLLQDVPLEELKDFSEESKEMQDVMVIN
jgi:hypothetical protein